MADESMEKYLLAGLDDRKRGFTRTVEIEHRETVCRATFRYETLVIETAGADSIAALNGMIRSLQERGYRQLRARLTFLGETYLGSREPWVDYADPEPASIPDMGLVDVARRIWRLLTRRS